MGLSIIEIRHDNGGKFVRRDNQESSIALGRYWTEDEVKFLQKNYETMTKAEIASALGRTEESVKKKMFALRHRKGFWKHVNLMLTEVQIGYLAATIDGEGSVSINKGKGCVSVVEGSQHRLAPRITIGNTDFAFIQKIQRMVPGCLERGSRKNPKHKICYYFIINGISRVYPVLKAIRNELVVKRKQADLVIEFCESRLKRKEASSPYTKRELEIYYEIKKLNRRGIKQ